MKAAKADLWSGLALAALGAYIIFQASRWEYLGNDGPGPGFFPLWYGIVMVALSLWLVQSSLRVENLEKIDWSGAGRAFGTWLALVVAVALLKVAGFLVCFALLTFFIIAVMYRRPWKLAAIAALAAAAGFYLVFQVALDVNLPPWTLFRG
jgi:putative tricarboxylic transport membrane protein